jgi:hypothetical protein
LKSENQKDNDMKNQIIKKLLNGAILVALVATVTQTASALPLPAAPDASSTTVLLGIACTGLVAVRRLLR